MAQAALPHALIMQPDVAGMEKRKLSEGMKEEENMSDSGSAAGTLAVLSLVLGLVSLLAVAILFGPAAIVCGAIAGTKGHKMGWWGMGIGIVGVVLWSFVVTSTS
jgi:hypothetical protein